MILSTNEHVQESAVIGIEDEIYGEVPKAFVVLKPGSHGLVKEQELIDYVGRQVASEKHLRGGVQFIEKFRRTLIGKIDMRHLRQMASKKF